MSKIAAVFPEYEIMPDHLRCRSGVWNALLNQNRITALGVIADIIGLPANSKSRGLILEAHDLQAITPRRKRRGDDHRYWLLAIELSTAEIMYFGFPTQEHAGGVGGLPPDYVRLDSELGVCHFTQSSGNIIPIQAIPVYRARLEGIEGFPRSATSITPFFDYGTGDLDCWIDDEFDVVYTL